MFTSIKYSDRVIALETFMAWDTYYDDWKLSAPDTEEDEELIEEEFEYEVE